MLRRTLGIAAVAGSLTLATSVPASAAAAADTTPPVVGSTGLAAGQWIGRQVRIIPVVSDNVGVTRVVVRINGELRGSADARVAASTGVPLTLFEEDDGYAVDLTVQAIDAAGNIGEARTRVSIDFWYPHALFEPGRGAILHGPATITATEISSDVTEIALTDNGKVLDRATAAPWTLSWDTRVHKGDAAKLAIAVKDRGGNVTGYDPGYLIDNTGPAIKLVNVPSVVGRGVTYSRADVTDTSGTERVEWWIDGVHEATGPGYTLHSGTKARTVNVTVKAWDRLSQASSVSRSVRVDLSGPSVTSVSPKAGALVRGSKIWSTVKAADPAGIAKAQLSGAAADTKAPYTSSIAAGKDGKKTLTWTVTDRVGNTTVVRRTVIVDNTKAVLKVTKAPKNKAKVKGTVKITAAASDRNGVARVELLVNGKVVAKDTKAAYRFSLNTKKYGKKIKVQLRAYDKAGNLTKTSTRTWYRR